MLTGVENINDNNTVLLYLENDLIIPFGYKANILTRIICWLRWMFVRVNGQPPGYVNNCFSNFYSRSGGFFLYKQIDFL